MLKTIIVDDQEFCTEVVRDILIEECPEVEVVSICNSGKEAIKAIGKLNPDLVILDVEMPGMSGFEMLQKFRQINFAVIFTTSFDKYSIQAIRYSALDYLLKPIVNHELKAAIRRISEAQERFVTSRFRDLFKTLSDTRRPRNQVALPASDGLIFLTVSEIVHCESDSNYTTLFLKSKEKIVVTKTLKEVENLLDGNDFFRIHNSHLVNINHIKKYVRGNAGYVVMTDGSHINIARNKKQEFLQQFVHF